MADLGYNESGIHDIRRQRKRLIMAAPDVREQYVQEQYAIRSLKEDNMENELSKALSVAEAKVRYDTQCKRVLSQKEVLAWILKNTVEEFKDLPLEEVEVCIEGKPEVSTVKVNPGETNETITGMPNESNVQGEGGIVYDIRFYASAPRSGEWIKLLINPECQKSWYPGYKIETRGIFYGARMISA